MQCSDGSALSSNSLNTFLEHAAYWQWLLLPPLRSKFGVAASISSEQTVCYMLTLTEQNFCEFVDVEDKI